MACRSNQFALVESGLQKWRRGWDSNPRYGFPYARFRGEYFQPLSHLSAVVADLIVAEQSIFRQLDNHPTGQGGAGGLEPFTTPAKSPRKKSARQFSDIARPETSA